MWLVWLISWLTLAACARREKDLVARAETVLAAARSLTAEALPPAQGIAEGNANMLLVLLAALFRAHHGLERAAAALSGHMSQFAQWLEEYDVQVSEATLCKYTLKEFLAHVNRDPSTASPACGSHQLTVRGCLLYLLFISQWVYWELQGFTFFSQGHVLL